jgi:type I restriction enzyme R subunit
VGTPAKLWSAWKEREDDPGYVAEIIGREIDPIEEAAIFDDFGLHRRKHSQLMEAGGRWATPLDQTLVSLCRPERLLDLSRRFTLFDGLVKKTAQSQPHPLERPESPLLGGQYRNGDRAVA